MTFGPEIKDPNATVNYTIDWSDNIPSETIGTSTWSSSPTGLTVGTGTFTGLSTTTSVAGGTAGTVYQVTNRVVTTNSITDERSVVVRVEHL